MRSDICPPDKNFYILCDRLRKWTLLAPTKMRHINPSSIEKCFGSISSEQQYWIVECFVGSSWRSLSLIMIVGGSWWSWVLIKVGIFMCFYSCYQNARFLILLFLIIQFRELQFFFLGKIESEVIDPRDTNVSIQNWMFLTMHESKKKVFLNHLMMMKISNIFSSR